MSHGVAYIAGPLFDERERWWITQIEETVAAAGEARLIGVHTDWRRRFDDEVVNLMIECSMDQIVRSLDELTSALGQRG